jgi:uncharacterized glyoxalase superfamily protein PhnB
MNAEETTEAHALHGVQPVLFVPSMEATIAYYRDVLGFHVDFEHGSPATHARVSSGRQNGAVAARIRFAPAETSAQSPSCQIYIHVGERIDELFEAYKARAVEILTEPTNRPWGLRDFRIRDCNGVVLIFACET